MGTERSHRLVEEDDEDASGKGKPTKMHWVFMTLTRRGLGPAPAYRWTTTWPTKAR